MMIVNLWTIKMPTSRRDISDKVTVTNVILNDRWFKICILHTFINGGSAVS